MTVGAAAAFIRKGLGEANASFVRFLALFSAILATAYSLISYKTPWCLLNFWFGIILLAGVGAAVVASSAAHAAGCPLGLAGHRELGARGVPDLDQPDQTAVGSTIRGVSHGRQRTAARRLPGGGSEAGRRRCCA